MVNGTAPLGYNRSPLVKTDYADSPFSKHAEALGSGVDLVGALPSYEW